MSPTAKPRTLRTRRIATRNPVPEQLRRLFDAHQLWVSSLDTAGTPLVLEDADFTGMDLRGLELAEAQLPGCRLDDADLSGANLYATNLASSSLVRATLDSANLNEANLDYADLTGAHLSGVTAISTRFYKANLTRATLRGAHLQAIFAPHAVLRHADLAYADLDGAVVIAADFRNTVGIDTVKASFLNVGPTTADVVRDTKARAWLRNAAHTGRDA